MTTEVNFSVDDSAVEELVANIEEAEGEVKYEADYAIYVEFPTTYGANGPPFTPIFNWVQRNWSDLDGGMKEAARSEGTPRGSRKHQKSVAWMVQQSIKKNGTEGVYFGQRTVEEARSEAPNIASDYQGSNDPEAPKELIQDVLDWMLENSQQIVRDEAFDTGTLHDSAEINDEITEGEEQ